MSVAIRKVQAAQDTAMRAAVEAAAAPTKDGSTGSAVTRDRLIETIGKNVMAWTKWNVLDDSKPKFNQSLRRL